MPQIPYIQYYFPKSNRLIPFFPQALQLPPHPTLKFAPPNSTASISSSVHAILPNLPGNSLRSHTSPLPSSGCTLPNPCPDRPPTLPYACEVFAVEEGGGVEDWDEDDEEESEEEGRP